MPARRGVPPRGGDCGCGESSCQRQPLGPAPPLSITPLPCPHPFLYLPLSHSPSSSTPRPHAASPRRTQAAALPARTPLPRREVPGHSLPAPPAPPGPKRRRGLRAGRGNGSATSSRGEGGGKVAVLGAGAA
ncbi:POU domain, class 6, transcription factor 2-like isoform X2 [Numida meleagris]|uniref:POU domain, class 6, transcription factor 2-like isoform X2 n=1 Tax=Numida meleagris TaxID=8996 RepID=UPI000B3D84A6|nr:POU domain, class 6, transcription factor 2-like isoform X2 [Numida meleagris]